MIRVLAWLSFGVGPILCHRVLACYLLKCRGAGGGRANKFLCKSTQLMHEHSTLMTSPLPKHPTSEQHHNGITVSTHELWHLGINIQPITMMLNIVLYFKSPNQRLLSQCLCGFAREICSAFQMCMNTGYFAGFLFLGVQFCKPLFLNYFKYGEAFCLVT